MFRPHKTSKKTRIKLYNTLALPALLWDSENGAIKARDARRITAAEMKYIWEKRQDKLEQTIKQAQIAK